jgi:hypothetical protein
MDDDDGGATDSDSDSDMSGMYTRVSTSVRVACLEATRVHVRRLQVTSSTEIQPIEEKEDERQEITACRGHGDPRREADRFWPNSQVNVQIHDDHHYPNGGIDPN